MAVLGVPCSSLWSHVLGRHQLLHEPLVLTVCLFPFMPIYPDERETTLWLRWCPIGVTVEALMSSSEIKLFSKLPKDAVLNLESGSGLLPTSILLYSRAERKGEERAFVCMNESTDTIQKQVYPSECPSLLKNKNCNSW